jgi:hypothetical protein
MSKIKLSAAILRDRAAGMSGLAIELKLRLRKALPPRSSKHDPFKHLRADLDAPRKWLRRGRDQPAG